MLSDKASKESWHSEALDAVVLILQTMFLRDYGTAQSPSKNGRNGLRMLTVGEEKHSPQSQEISTQLVPVLQVILSNFASPDDNVCSARNVLSVCSLILAQIPRSYIIPQYAACIARFVVCQRSLFGSVLRSCDDWVAALARIIAPWLDNVCLEEKMHTEVAPAPSALRLTIKNMSVYNQFIILLTRCVTVPAPHARCLLGANQRLRPTDTPSNSRIKALTACQVCMRLGTCNVVADDQHLTNLYLLRNNLPPFLTLFFEPAKCWHLLLPLLRGRRRNMVESESLYRHRL